MRILDGVGKILNSVHVRNERRLKIPPKIVLNIFVQQAGQQNQQSMKIMTSRAVDPLQNAILAFPEGVCSSFASSVRRSKFCSWLIAFAFCRVDWISAILTFSFSMLSEKSDISMSNCVRLRACTTCMSLINESRTVVIFGMKKSTCTEVSSDGATGDMIFSWDVYMVHSVVVMISVRPLVISILDFSISGLHSVDTVSLNGENRRMRSIFLE